MGKHEINGRAALYVRLSKEDIDKEADFSQSIINQRLLLTDYALEHGYQIVDVYIDEDYSGLYDDRPEFDRLLRDAKIGKFSIVIAKSQSRFTRSMEHLEKYIHHDFVMLGIRFIGIVDGIDTNIKGNKKARQIYGLTNEWYSEDLSESIRIVFQQKMKAGQFIGAFAPYGYLKNPEDRHKFIIDRYAAEVVRKIYHLYLQGFSIKRICHILEDDGIPNPTVYKAQQGLTYQNMKSQEFGQKYNLWSETTVKRILKNETYIGKLIQGTCEKLSYKDKRVVSVPKEKWIIIDNHHEPIIDADLFEKVKALRGKRRQVAINQKGDKKIHILAGKLRCKECGSTMIKSGGVRGKKDWYLRCQLANKTRLKECSGHNIVYSIVENAVLENIQQLVYPILNNAEDKRNLTTHIESIINSNDQIKNTEKILSEMSSKISSQTEILKALYLDRVNGNLSEEMFMQLKDDIEYENNELTKRIKTLTAEVETLNREQESKRNIDELIKKYCDYSSLTHEMVADFIDYVEIGEKTKSTDRQIEQEIIIHWNL